MNYLMGFLVGCLIVLFLLGWKKDQTITIETVPTKYSNFAEQLGQHYRPIYQKRLNATKLANELKCLADNIYQEAGSEPIEGQMAVATVVVNRMKDPEYPKTICGIVYERHFNRKLHKVVCQFSWTCKPRHIPNKEAYKQAREVAKQVYIKHRRLDIVGDATLYHAVYVHPDWADKSEQIERIGSHIFYKE